MIVGIAYIVARCAALNDDDVATLAIWKIRLSKNVLITAQDTEFYAFHTVYFTGNLISRGNSGQLDQGT